MEMTEPSFQRLISGKDSLTLSTRISHPPTTLKLLEPMQKYSEGARKQLGPMQEYIEGARKQLGSMQKYTEGGRKQIEKISKYTEGGRKQIEPMPKYTEGERKQLGSMQKYTEGGRKQIESMQEYMEGRRKQIEQMSKYTEGERKQLGSMQKYTERARNLYDIDPEPNYDREIDSNETNPRKASENGKILSRSFDSDSREIGRISNKMKSDLNPLNLSEEISAVVEKKRRRKKIVRGEKNIEEIDVGNNKINNVGNNKINVGINEINVGNNKISINDVNFKRGSPSDKNVDIKFDKNNNNRNNQVDYTRKDNSYSYNNNNNNYITDGVNISKKIITNHPPPTESYEKSNKYNDRNYENGNNTTTTTTTNNETFDSRNQSTSDNHRNIPSYAADRKQYGGGADKSGTFQKNYNQSMISGNLISPSVKSKRPELLHGPPRSKIHHSSRENGTIVVPVDRSDWMKIFHSRPLTSVCLPGTYQSASSCLHGYKGTKNYGRYETFKITSSHSLHQPLPDSWLSCQGRSISDQLKSGVRILDVQLLDIDRKVEGIGFLNTSQSYANSSDAWCIFMNLGICPLRDLLMEIKGFLKRHPSEIVGLHLGTESQISELYKKRIGLKVESRIDPNQNSRRASSNEKRYKYVDWIRCDYVLKEVFKENLIPEHMKNMSIGNLTDLGRNIFIVGMPQENFSLSYVWKGVKFIGPAAKEWTPSDLNYDLEIYLGYQQPSANSTDLESSNNAPFSDVRWQQLPQKPQDIPLLWYRAECDPIYSSVLSRHQLFGSSGFISRSLGNLSNLVTSKLSLWNNDKHGPEKGEAEDVFASRKLFAKAINRLTSEVLNKKLSNKLIGTGLISISSQIFCLNVITMDFIEDRVIDKIIKLNQLGLGGSLGLFLECLRHEDNDPLNQQYVRGSTLVRVNEPMGSRGSSQPTKDRNEPNNFLFSSYRLFATKARSESLGRTASRNSSMRSRVLSTSRMDNGGKYITSSYSPNKNNDSDNNNKNKNNNYNNNNDNTNHNNTSLLNNSALSGSLANYDNKNNSASFEFQPLKTSHFVQWKESAM